MFWEISQLKEEVQDLKSLVKSLMPKMEEEPTKKWSKQATIQWMPYMPARFVPYRKYTWWWLIFLYIHFYTCYTIHSSVKFPPQLLSHSSSRRRLFFFSFWLHQTEASRTQSNPMVTGRVEFSEHRRIVGTCRTALPRTKGAQGVDRPPPPPPLQKMTGLLSGSSWSAGKSQRTRTRAKLSR